LSQIGAPEQSPLYFASVFDDTEETLTIALNGQGLGDTSEGLASVGFVADVPGDGASPYTSTFSFTAMFDEDCQGCTLIYVDGNGTVTVNAVAVAGEPNNGYFQATQAVYTFDPPASTVPEPGTLALFAFGLVGLATRRKVVRQTASCGFDLRA
jgi:PEP-CTERM motif